MFIFRFIFSEDSYHFTQKSKIKKKRNYHLNQQIEKKAPLHGTDVGLDPDYGPKEKTIRDRKTFKPRAKQNKLQKIHQ